MYEKELKALRGILWALSEDLSINALAGKSDLCHATVTNFFTSKTKNPSYRTISNLCHAIGVKVEISGKQLRLRAA